MRLPDLPVERGELAATEWPSAKIFKEYARYEMLVLDKWLTEDVNDTDISCLSELVEPHCAAKSTVLCMQHAPAEWRSRLDGGVQADATVNRPVCGSVNQPRRRRRARAVVRGEVAVRNSKTGGTQAARAPMCKLRNGWRAPRIIQSEV